MALPVNGSTHLIPAYYSIYRPRKDKRLSWPSWLTYSGWLTHISGHPSAAGRAQDRESSPARDRRSTTVPRHPLCTTMQNSCVVYSAKERERDRLELSGSPGNDWKHQCNDCLSVHASSVSGKVPLQIFISRCVISPRGRSHPRLSLCVSCVSRPEWNRLPASLNF